MYVLHSHRMLCPKDASVLKRDLSTEEEEENKELSARRQPAEHIMALIKNHAILGGCYRGEFPQIQAYYKVIVHTTAYMLRNTPPGERGSLIRVKRLRPDYQSDDEGQPLQQRRRHEQ